MFSMDGCVNQIQRIEQATGTAPGGTTDSANAKNSIGWTKEFQTDTFYFTKKVDTLYYHLN